MSDRGTVCGNCGTVNELGAQFCMNCGALLAAYVSALTPPPAVSDQEPESEMTEATPTSPSAQGPVSPSESTPSDEPAEVTEDQPAAIVPATDGIEPGRAPEHPAPEPPVESAPPGQPEAIPLPQPGSSSQLSPTESHPHDRWPAPQSQGAPMRRPWPTPPPSPAANHTDIPRQETTAPVSTPGPQPTPPSQAGNAWSQQQPPPPTWSTGAPSAPPPPTPRVSGTPPQTWIVLGSVLILISCVVGVAGSAVDLPFFFDAPAWCTFPIGVIILVIGLVQLATQRPRP